MERIGSSVIEILSVLLLRKRPALLVAALAIGAVFIPIPDKEANAVVERTSSLPKTITAASYKPDDGLEVSQVPMPRFHTSLLNSIRGTNPTRLLIRVHSAAINPVDYKLRAPLLPFIRWIKPNGVARDFSGTVELVIPGNDGCTLKKGDEVFGVAPEGALQEYTITTCAGKAIKPKQISFNTAAGVGVAAGTSYEGLVKNGPIEGKRVLIIGGSGGTGSVAVQMAHIMGARVTAICSGKNRDYCKSLGADEVIDYTSPTWQKEIDEVESFDLIYDTVSSTDDTNYVLLTKHKLAPKGQYVAINGQLKEWAIAFIRLATGKNFGPANYELIIPDLNKSDRLEAIAELMTRNGEKLNIEEDTVYNELNRETVNAGFERQKSRRAKGKIIYEIVHHNQEAKH